MRVQVGLSKLKDEATGKKRVYKYSDVPTKEGWVDNLNYLPIPFDLMYLQVRGKTKPISGWWTGQGWKGIRLKKGEKVAQWKRNYEYDRM